MHESPQPKQDPSHMMANAYHRAMLSIACLVLVWFRKPGTVGEFFFKANGKGAVIWLAVLSCFGIFPLWPSVPAGAAFGLLAGLYVMRLIVHHWATKRALAQGEEVHSYAVGISRLWCDKTGFRDLDYVERVWEPVCCVVLGILLSFVCVSLGLMFFFGTFGLLYLNWFFVHQAASIKRKVRDAKLDQKMIRDLMEKK